MNLKKISVGAWLDLFAVVFGVGAIIAYNMSLSKGYFKDDAVSKLMIYSVIAVCLALAVFLSDTFTDSGDESFIIADLFKVFAPVMFTVCVFALISSRTEGLVFIRLKRRNTRNHSNSRKYVFRIFFDCRRNSFYVGGICVRYRNVF